MNLGNISKEHLSFNTINDVPKYFTGSCCIGSGIYYFKDGKKHREDGPAIVFENSDKNWYINGLRHREDGPAIEWSSGYKVWCIRGKRHRLDGPAVEKVNGEKAWYLNGEIHGTNNDFTNESWFHFQRTIIF